MQTTHAALMPHDSPILRVHSLGSDEGSLTLNELTVLCTQLSTKVTSLEEDLKQTKKVYGNAYTKLILKVKKLEKTVKTSQARMRAKIVVSDNEEDEEDYSKQGRILIEDMDLDAGISLVPLHVADQGRFDDTHVSDQPEEQLGVFSAAKVLADAARIRRGVENVHTYTRRRTVSTGSGLVSTAGMAGVSTASGLVSTAGMAQEVEINIPSPVATKDKGKAVMQEYEPPKKIKKRVQIQMSIDEELAQKLHEEEQARFNAKQEAKFNEEQEQERLDYEAAVRIQEELDESERQRMAQVHQAAQGFTDAEWDDILARVAADEDLVQQLQAGEKYSEEDLPRKLMELVNQRKKFFAQQRAEAKRNKPMTPVQQKAYMSTYIKNQEGGYSIKKLKSLSFEQVKEIFETTMRRIGEVLGLVQEQSDEEPKADELSQEQLQQLMIIVPKEGMNVEALQTKVGNYTEVYQVFEDMLNNFNKDDLVKQWSLVYERFNSTELTDDKAKELWVELKSANVVNSGNCVDATHVDQMVTQLDHNSLDGKDNDGLNLSPTKVTPGNSAENKEDNLHDENDGLASSKSTANPDKGTSYANLFTGGSSRKTMNFRTLYTPLGNGVDVVVPMESIRAISKRFANTAYGFFLGKRVAYPFIRNNPPILKKWNPDVNLLKKDVGNVLVWVKLHGVPVTAFSKDGLSVIATKLGTPLMLDSYTSYICIQSWGRSSYARALIEVRADVELKENIMVAMPKLVGERFYTCNVRVEYEWEPLRCVSCKVFGHGHNECPKNIASGVAKNLKKPSQAPRGVFVGPKVGFKPTKQAYRVVPKQTNANTSGGKKKDVEPAKENVGSSSHNTTHIAEKIDKIKKLIIDWQVTLVDDEGKPVEKVDYSGDHDSEDEVASTDNDMAIFWLLRR
ncbi:putative reverse transcriptase domain-containing protein [Tanacetum coccineum]